ncbi:hypothetical protein CSOJ01_05017 [Colletotrichum sojae]|uniref:Uncharacterized protein n=1 Tax=Colletotrichum sojae TaxID=2175907 RepID=A0A8H6JHI3_9PEZI|nr:hypothetical protein CSOJ01_05017 [Colletotrichum sojae]
MFAEVETEENSDGAEARIMYGTRKSGQLTTTTTGQPDPGRTVLRLLRAACCVLMRDAEGAARTRKQRTPLSTSTGKLCLELRKRSV